jgi:sugar lactone lactonase YvrE
MGVEIFDERICVLGESPVAFGKSNSEISWVDILGSRVLTRNLITGEVGAFSTAENVGFALRRVDGGYLLGTNSGPILRDTDGSLHTLFSLQEVDPQTRFHSVRWNDAKIAPNGDLFRYSPTDGKLRVLLRGLTISNGMDWSEDGQTFYYIDSSWQAIRSFSVSDDGLGDSKTVVQIDPQDGGPDGMCLDSEGGIWVALWGGSEIRRYDSKQNFLLSERVILPAKYVTSCTFAGENLDTLIVTSATDGHTDLSPESGMTFYLQPGVTGLPTRAFAL